MASDATNTPPPILLNLLVRLLREAAEIEQQLMIQYLYAAFSMKKRPDETCTPAQYEAVRRWQSTVYMVARQEMEHLALVNGMLSAIGAEPFFDRQNIPLQFSYYLGRNLKEGKLLPDQPCDIPFLFERFNLPVIERFVCFESPSLATLQASGDRIPVWCFSCEGQPYPSTSAGERLRGEARDRPLLFPLAGSRIPDELLAAAQEEMARLGGPVRSSPSDTLKPGTIQELYDQVELLFRFLSSRWNLYTGNPNSQVFVPVEYQINIFPITDLPSTLQALRLIVEEGEGIDAPPDYQSHFIRFYDVHDQLVALLAADPRFDPSLPVPFNPSGDAIRNPFARELFDLFNYTYATLLFLLTALYADFEPQASQSYPFFSSALQENAFGPMMTMLLRPLAEIMAYTVSDDGGHTTGPSFELSDADRALLNEPSKLGNIELFLGRLDEITVRLGRLTGTDLAAVARGAGDVPFLDRQLRFVYESATAMTNNMRRIYQLGQLPQFVVAP
ncbi:MAG TPA: ferritin-like domain-containing protein [Thermoanaerobaculia bacterium]|nr:ferritin-like domain-containing protein [Thermoanaerobaculia bacterium]